MPYVSTNYRSNAAAPFGQGVTGTGSPIHARLIRFGGHGLANDGDGFYVID